jgi:uncharacterized repeat protein (TIGR03803 family)
MNTLSLMMKTLLVLAIATILVSVALPSALAQTETVLYSFDDNGTDGWYPAASLVRDAKGNLYGTTREGGANGDGTVFELTASGAETTLYSFGGTTTEGISPNNLIRDAEGNFYGTTYLGGTYGFGTVFEFAPSGAETTLYSFGKSTTDGHDPRAGVVRDMQGNLYGTTTYGGTATCEFSGCGTVFELTASGTETILHRFDNNGRDGYQPSAGLVLDTKGNLYGTAINGGAYDDCGIAFELTSSGKEKILHSFGKTATDGCSPWAGLIRDTKGNLYGTTLYGGVHGDGTVFEVTPSGTETILYSFGGTATDGQNPYGVLVRDTEGNLYGTTIFGGAGDCQYGCGAVFEVTLSGTETILHRFGETATDGQGPDAGLVRDSEGNLYGTTTSGGTYGGGTVFEVKP